MLDARRRACLNAMGIELWRARTENRGSRSEDSESRLPAPAVSAIAISTADTETAVPVSDPGPPAVAEAPRPPALESVSSLGWDELREAVAHCRACDLHAGRTQTVFGVGDRRASLMVIGEAPGADEDRQGEPFVGRAGQLLNAMLAAIGFAREQVYIANIIKCRPPANRDPHVEETAACQPFLHRQIALLQPKLILSIGRISAHNLLGTEESVARLRGRTHRFDPGDIPLIVTYHPAYLLRRPQDKAKAWQDLQAAHRQLNQA